MGVGHIIIPGPCYKIIKGHVRELSYYKTERFVTPNSPFNFVKVDQYRKMIRREFWQMQYYTVDKFMKPVFIADHSVKAFEQITSRPSETWPIKRQIIELIRVKPSTE